ncbi:MULTISPECIES: alpha/beta fold hydrolase [unclassified Streptomyces]|uniref:alpha/beta fold hydrolase n=1 Tax=unclassified Streptomyces TaxID=2593676 RepID=UPI000CD4FDD5|nr:MULTISPECIES: alpha/beta hydrolase [unclassified Streptomyces]
MPSISVKSDRPDIADVELHYEDAGSGRPVVLVHGWPLSGRSWQQQVDVLTTAGHRVVTYDRRGFGQSSQPANGYDYDTLAADLAALLDALDLRDVTLVGFSMGGGEVVRYLSRYGTARVSRAVLAAAVPPYLHKTGNNPEGGLDDATIAEFEDGVRSDRPAFLDSFVTQFFQAGDRDDLVSPAQHADALAMAVPASPTATLECIGAFARTDFREEVAAIDIPTLVIHGDSDGIVPFEVSGRRSHEAIVGSQLVLVEGAPHGLNVTHADRFNEELLRFLAQ